MYLLKCDNCIIVKSESDEECLKAEKAFVNLELYDYGFIVKVMKEPRSVDKENKQKKTLAFQQFFPKDTLSSVKDRSVPAGKRIRPFVAMELQDYEMLFGFLIPENYSAEEMFAGALEPFVFLEQWFNRRIKNPYPINTYHEPSVSLTYEEVANAR